MLYLLEYIDVDYKEINGRMYRADELEICHVVFSLDYEFTACGLPAGAEGLSTAAPFEDDPTKARWPKPKPVICKKCAQLLKPITLDEAIKAGFDSITQYDAQRQKDIDNYNKWMARNGLEHLS